MKRTEVIMGMPITVMIPARERRTGRSGDRFTLDEAADGVFAQFRARRCAVQPIQAGQRDRRIDRGELA